MLTKEPSTKQKLSQLPSHATVTSASFFNPSNLLCISTNDNTFLYSTTTTPTTPSFLGEIPIRNVSTIKFQNSTTHFSTFSSTGLISLALGFSTDDGPKLIPLKINLTASPDTVETFHLSFSYTKRLSADCTQKVTLIEHQPSVKKMNSR